jgi:hypothetical protein
MPKSADSDSEPGKHDGSPGIERTKPWHSADDVPWTLLTEPQLADAYEAHVFGISSSTNHYLTDMLFGRQYCKARQL